MITTIRVFRSSVVTPLGFPIRPRPKTPRKVAWVLQVQGAGAIFWSYKLILTTKVKFCRFRMCDGQMQTHCLDFVNGTTTWNTDP